MTSGPHIRLVLWKAAKAIERVDRASIVGTGLQLSEFTIMEALLHKGPLPINTIGEKVLLTSGSMTAAINRLEKKGFVRRIQGRSDGRFFHVHLTEIGRMVIKNAYQKHAAHLEQVVAVLNQGERQTFLQLLKKIGRHAEEVHIDSKP